MFWFIYYLLYVPIKLIAPTKIINKKNFNKKKNYVIVCNHQSGFDPIIMLYGFKKRIRFIAKKELWKGKKKSFLYDTVCKCIPVDRSKGLTLSATKDVYNLLNNNECLGLFPEGTRKQTTSEMLIKDGACLFSIKSKTPILPCFILKKQKLFKRNVMIVGEPFEFSEFYDKK